jgi:hypothetical protein
VLANPVVRIAFCLRSLQRRQKTEGSKSQIAQENTRLKEHGVGTVGACHWTKLPVVAGDAADAAGHRAEKKARTHLGRSIAQFISG